MSIVSRVKGILFKPSEEWEIIANEQTTVAGLFTGYAAILALIPAIIGVLAALLLGSLIANYAGGAIGALSTSALIMQQVLGYFLGLALVFGMGFLVSAISPGFNGKQDLVQSTKLIVYAGTSTWVSALFLIIPVLGILLYLAGLAYSVYLIYLGVRPLLGVPQEKVMGMTVVTVLAYIIAAVVMYLVLQSLGGAGGMGTMPGA
jgi:ABC-type multidrug transport system permease subunit